MAFLVWYQRLSVVDSKNSLSEDVFTQSFSQISGLVNRKFLLRKISLQNNHLAFESVATSTLH